MVIKFQFIASKYKKYFESGQKSFLVINLFIFLYVYCRSFKVLKSKKLHEVLEILAEGLVRELGFLLYQLLAYSCR